MHDIRLIRENPEPFLKGVRDRGSSPEEAQALFDRLVAMDDARRRAIAALQEAQERRNARSKEIGQAKAKKDDAKAQALMAEVAQLKEETPRLEAAEREASKALNDALAEIPNTPNPDVPVGSDEHGNVERSRFKEPRDLATPKQHFELGEAMGLMDFETAAKLSGSRFVVLRGELARLERALGQFMIDLHTTEHGYTEVAPSLLVRDEVMYGTAQLPKFADDQFSTSRRLEDVFRRVSQGIDKFSAALRWLMQNRERLDETDYEVSLAVIQDELRELEKEQTQERLWLIPTAEVPLTNLVRESIVAEDELPLRYTALTHCFRAEAGAAGKDTRGMLRQHQFVKCELVSITTPEQSAEEHERMLGCAEEVLRRLDLPYRVMTLCTGDMGFASAKTYDIEVWLPGQGAFREISSCSVCTDFQARRMNARYRPKEGKGPRFVHTLNGSGVAVGRALIAVLENYQNEDGSVTVPSALMPYMGGVTRIGKA
jgi:seryl-tRNA synthetase